MAPDFPVFNSSDFSGEATAAYFDLIKLQDNPDIPRGFPHRHNYYHLLWMTEAEGTHMLDFESFPVRANTVFFVSPGQLHAWNSTVKPKGYVINFSTEFFVQMFPRSDDIAQFPFFHIARDTPVLDMDQAQHDQLLPLLVEMEKEVLSRGDGRLDIVRSYLLVLLTRLRRLYPEHPADSISPQNYSLTKRYKLLIEQHYLDFGPVRDYAEKLHVTERQLNDALKRTLGKTAGQLVQERMVLEAKRLLSNTDLSVAEIAFQLNFEDFAYFCRFFKKHTQSTPGDFACEVGEYGVRVNAVMPSIIETRLTAPLKERPEIYNTYAAHTVLNRWGQPSEVGAAVAFLASDAASYITGSSLSVDGGWTAIDGPPTGLTQTRPSE